MFCFSLMGFQKVEPGAEILPLFSLTPFVYLDFFFQLIFKDLKQMNVLNLKLLGKDQLLISLLLTN